MILDDFKKPWQQQQRKLDRQVDHVIKAVRTRMSSFDCTIWFRDLRETIVAVGVLVWFGYSMFQHDQWMAKLGAMIVVLASIMIIIVLNWTRLTGRVARPGQSLHDYCGDELDRVDRQIWLLKNINWWYTGPILAGVTIQLLGILSPPQVLIFVATLLIPIAWFIHWLNQFSVRTELLPLRHELAGARALGESDAMVADADAPLLDADELFSDANPVKPNWRRMIVLGVLWMMLFGLGGFLHERLGVNEDAPKISPFTEVRFADRQVIVTYAGKDYQWLEIDGIRVEDMIRSAKWRFGFMWKKRIAEDMVDVLWGMGHQPGETVRLELRDLETGGLLKIQEAAMTSENRSAVYWNHSHRDKELANAVGDDETAGDLLIDQDLLSRLSGRYELAPDFIFDVRDDDGHLLVGITNQATQEVFPDSPTRWAYRSVDAALVFQLDVTGPAHSLVLHQNGIEQTAQRIK